MTIRFPEKSIGDRVLSRLGKKRAVSFPTQAIKRYGVYVPTKEPFLRALLRPRSQKPPKGWFYPDDILP